MVINVIVHGHWYPTSVSRNQLEAIQKVLIREPPIQTLLTTFVSQFFSRNSGIGRTEEYAQMGERMPRIVDIHGGPDHTRRKVYRFRNKICTAVGNEKTDSSVSRRKSLD